MPNRGNDKKRRSGDFGEIYIVDNDDSTESKLSHILKNSSDNVEENFDYWSDININNHKDK
ncbi:15549_t:CDS:1, partial [Entrophospora sp. SA101]